MLLHLKRLDWLLIASALLLVTFGLISIYSSGGEELTNFKRQILWLAIGFFLMLFVSFLDYRILKNYKAPVTIIYIFSLLLLIGLFIFGVSVRGATSWYHFGPVSFEPVERQNNVFIIQTEDSRISTENMSTQG